MTLASIPRTLTVLCTAFLVAPAAALAADGEKTPLNLGSSEKTTEVAAGAGGGGLVRTIVGLAIVIGVIYGLYWVLKQVKSSREERSSGNGLESLATLPLGTNRALHLVRAGDEVVLVGVGESGVTPIRTYSEAEARALGVWEETITVVPGATGRPDPFAQRDGGAARAAGRAGLGRALDELRRRTVIK
jgi:flagellar protein FliO/FliZ